MKKIIITILTVLCIVIAGTSAYAYHIIREPLVENYTEASNFVTSNELLQSIDSVHYYHGTTAHYVVKGLDEDGDEAIVWVKDDFETVNYRKASDGITYEQALSIAERALGESQIEQIRLGFTRGIPVYEVMYNDANQRKGYYYLTFDEGTFIKRYSIRNVTD
ncbi:DUF5590 domain-containing protein [Alkalihalophilus lindianensis]|uniref:DUF5590 domain-containing protein n=1 Tax=Alkalihalophilus lindianensis TaxID=1630542 RepID=A0ABU3X6J2_9BACI|nr:DUF5590 domain-containing protein [Alkalihalophilus lindianensis]MDV2683505.1 DUF5590 domain-containing protein [Alkalihalophilus lindianensis]